eukprot:scaffold72071_cov19-Tisochrysis_lutea.AAC.1
MHGLSQQARVALGGQFDQVGEPLQEGHLQGTQGFERLRLGCAQTHMMAPHEGAFCKFLRSHVNTHNPSNTSDSKQTLCVKRKQQTE